MDCLTASLRGSSFYKLPKVLQWFSGSSNFRANIMHKLHLHSVTDLGRYAIRNQIIAA
jgi:hypothetical protein